MKKWCPMILTTITMLLWACDGLTPGSPEENEMLDGPTQGLSKQEIAQFIKGDIAFNDEIFTPLTGLGPIFVANSCGSCHAGDGKGHPFTTLTRFGQADTTGNQYLAMGGPQLQARAIPGFRGEVLPAGAPFTKITPPAVTGLGFLQEISDEDILAMADPDDIDGDGISGRVNWITVPAYVVPRNGSITNNGRYIGRMGKKAAVFDLLQQTVNAYNQDMGITSTFESKETLNGKENDPEVSNATVHDVVFYLQTLKAPIPRSTDLKGKELMTTLGCTKCHVSTYQTGFSSIQALSNKTIHPYSDLLLHDMGPGLDDGYTEGSALTSEWRTPPLWGLGLSKNSQGGRYFLMHDGRAESIEEAIALHGGEANNSRDAFLSLSEEEKKHLIKFLESL